MSFEQVLNDIETALNTNPSLVGSLYWDLAEQANPDNTEPPYTVVDLQPMADSEFREQVTRTEVPFLIRNTIAIPKWRTTKTELVETFNRVEDWKNVMNSLAQNLTCEAYFSNAPDYKHDSTDSRLNIYIEFTMNIDTTRT